MKKFFTKEVTLKRGPCHGKKMVIHKWCKKVTYTLKDGSDHEYIIEKNIGWYNRRV